MVDDTYDLYTDFFGVSEWDSYFFSFFQKPIRNIEPLRAIGIPDIYRYIVGPYAKEQTETLRSIQDKDAARKYKAENFDFCTFSGIFHTRNKSDLLLQSDLLCIDFDHVADIPSLKDRLLHDKYLRQNCSSVHHQGTDSNGLSTLIVRVGSIVVSTRQSITTLWQQATRNQTSLVVTLLVPALSHTIQMHLLIQSIIT